MIASKKPILIRLSIAVVPWLMALELSGQGTFQNLDFEGAVFVPVGGSSNVVEADPALQAWSAYLGTNQLSNILHNTISLTPFAQIAIWGPDEPQPGLFHGQYYVLLRGGDDPFGAPGTVGAAIAQTGTIPGTAQSLRFYFAFGGVSVTFGGQHIPLLALDSSQSGYTIYGGDISAFAGQTGELRIEASGYLDFIQFSNQPIPEPSTVALFGVGALLLSWRMRRDRRR